MRPGRDSRYIHGSRLGPRQKTMPHQLEPYRSDTDQGLCFDHTFRAGSQYIEMLHIVVSTSTSQQHTAKARTHPHRIRGGDMDARCNDWHCVRVRDATAVGDLDWQMHSLGTLTTSRTYLHCTDPISAAILDYHHIHRHCHRSHPDTSISPHGMDAATRLPPEDSRHHDPFHARLVSQISRCHT
jgi:hypothetical protein